MVEYGWNFLIDDCGVMVEMPSEGKLGSKVRRRVGLGGMVIALDW